MTSCSAPLLALETSGNSLGVGLHTESGVVFEENVIEGMIHGRALAPLMKKALESQQIKPSELGAVAVSLGPGSWTGLRIGISAAKAFAWAAKIPLICVPSFEALALAASEASPDTPVMTVRDARSEGFFAAIIAVTNGAPVRLLEERVLKPDALIEVAKGLALKSLSVCGDAKCLQILSGEIQANDWTALSEWEHIPARAVARCGWRRWQADEEVLRSAAEIHKAGPLYLRASDPELKLEKRNG